ncbi:MAG: hypothetical protein GX100_09465 [candidate division WS1 bacterium]|nr:hypothetical protein [candidate division WS1 bacterium]
MELLYKPDAEEACQRWEAFWQGEMIDRPPVVFGGLRRPDAEDIPGPSQLLGFDGDFARAFEIVDRRLSGGLFLAETFPCHPPSLGPDQVAGFLGCKIGLNEASGDTSWVEPCVEDWESALPLTLDPENRYWKHILEFCAYLRPRARGRFLLGHLDLHGNLDGLGAMRGYERLCMDLVDAPELIDRAVEQICALFPEIYDAVYEAAGMAEVGYTTSWGALVAPGKTNMLQCDFSAMMSPAMFNRWVMPCLEVESQVLDHSAYHLDGPEALCHVPSLLSLPRVHVMQWVIGAGLQESRPITTWIELYQQFQAAGKACQIPGSIEELKVVHKQLKPNLVQYITWVNNVAEAEDFLKWLQENS